MSHIAWNYRTLALCCLCILLFIGYHKVTGLNNQRRRTSLRNLADNEEKDKVTRAKFVVTTILEPPYMMLKQDGIFLTGNDRFEGFMADVIKSLASKVGFNYELRLVQDGTHGKEGENGSWTGMIGEIYKGHADLALGPIVVTPDREKVVEFTDPILTFKSAALLKKPKEAHRKRRPKRRSRIRTLDELYHTRDLVYGVISGSTTEAMFKSSHAIVLQSMWSQMVNSWPSTFVHSVQEGVQRAEREEFAFILDSPMADYIASRKPCSLYATGTFLDEQSYAIALRHSHSTRLRQSLNEHIFELKQSGDMQTLYEKWWTSECDKKRDAESPAVGNYNTLEPSTANPWLYVTVRNAYSYGRNSANTWNTNRFTYTTTVCYILQFSVFHIVWSRLNLVL